MASRLPIELDAQAGPIPAWSVDSTPIPVESEYQNQNQNRSFSNNTTTTLAKYGSSANLAGMAGIANDGNSSRSSQTLAGIPQLDYRLYSPPQFKLSPDGTTLSSHAAANLVENAAALAAFLRNQAMVPPKPQIHMKGSRPTRVDFDIKLNLMGLLVPDALTMRTNYIRCAGDGELAFRGGHKQDVRPAVGDGGLEEWCRMFVGDAAESKSFTLARTVTNLDTMYIEGQLRSLISSIGYKGNLAISFPTTHARVTVQSAHRVHKLVTSLKTILRPKSKYEVVQAVWPFATARMGEDGRQYTVQSEEAWWREWRDPIKFAIATQRQGWVTNEDKLEALMEGKGKGVQPLDWDME